MVERIVNKLCGIDLSVREIEYGAPHFGFAKRLLQALAQVTWQQVTTDHKPPWKLKALTPAEI